MSVARALNKERGIPAISEEGKTISEDFEGEFSKVYSQKDPVHGIAGDRPPLRLGVNQCEESN